MLQPPRLALLPFAFLLLLAILLLAGPLLAGAAVGQAAAETLSSADREHYKNAFIHFEKKRERDARLHAARAENALPAKVIRWLLMTRPGARVTFEEARAFFEENPEWPRLRALQRALERAMPSSLPDAEILAWFEAHPPITSDGAVLQIGALLRAGRADEARALIREAWRTLSFDRSQEQAFRSRYRKVLTQDDHVARIDRLLWNRSRTAAQRLARRIGDGYPELVLARNALAANKGGVDAAIRKVPTHLRDDPGLIYERANWRKRKDRYKGVVELLAPLPGDLPRADRWWRLRQWTVREGIELRDYENAYRIASNHGLHTGSQFADAEWLAGWTAFAFLKQPKQAYRHFSRLYYGSSSPISLARGAYWAGEASQAMGNGEWAERWYRAAAQFGTTFYGQLATSRLGQPVALDLPQNGAPSAAERAAFDKRELVRVVRLLEQLRQGKHQETVLYHLRDLAKTDIEYQLVADLAREVGQPEIAVSTAKQARNEGIWLLDHLYPAPSIGTKATPEQALVLAVIRQESAFDSRAVSHAGARGLMQLMPATAKQLAKKMRIGYSRDRLTNDPDYNLRLGRAYLRRLLDRYDGAHVLALAAYNAGPHRVRQWIRRNGDPRDPDVDPVGWIESIPFSETRNYVMRVLEGLVVYRQRLNSQLVELPLAPATQ